MSTPASQLPFLPQILPTTQAAWQQVVNILQQWQTPLNAVVNTTSSVSFTATTLLNNWSDYTGGQANPVGFYADPFGRVWLRGVLLPGIVADGTQVLSLTALPTNNQTMVGLGYTGSAYIPIRLDVTPIGNVVLYGGSSITNSGFISLDGLSYATSQ